MELFSIRIQRTFQLVSTSKEEVEKLKTESVRLILNSLNSETDEKKE